MEKRTRRKMKRFLLKNRQNCKAMKRPSEDDDDREIASTSKKEKL